MADDSGKPVPNEIIHASDIYSKEEVNNLIMDPTANTVTVCVGYDQDILGGYVIE